MTLHATVSQHTPGGRHVVACSVRPQMPGGHQTGTPHVWEQLHCLGACSSWQMTHGEHGFVLLRTSTKSFVRGIASGLLLLAVAVCMSSLTAALPGGDPCTPDPWCCCCCPSVSCVCQPDLLTCLKPSWSVSRLQLMPERVRKLLSSVLPTPPAARKEGYCKYDGLSALPSSSPLRAAHPRSST